MSLLLSNLLTINIRLLPTCIWSREALAAKPSQYAGNQTWATGNSERLGSGEATVGIDRSAPLLSFRGSPSRGEWET